MVVIAFDAVADVIGCVEDGLINKPGAGLRGQIQNLVVLFNGMTAKTSFSGESFPGINPFPIVYPVPANYPQ